MSKVLTDFFFFNLIFLLGAQCLLFQEKRQKNGTQGSGKQPRGNEKNEAFESRPREFKSGYTA